MKVRKLFRVMTVEERLLPESELRVPGQNWKIFSETRFGEWQLRSCFEQIVLKLITPVVHLFRSRYQSLS
jgi:hypothetical protein